MASLNEEQLSKKSATNVETMLQNAAAGVVVSLASSNPSEKIRVRVRGEASLTGDNEPLYVVDGMARDFRRDECDLSIGYSIHGRVEGCICGSDLRF